jgi:predicted nucleotide-binding protein
MKPFYVYLDSKDSRIIECVGKVIDKVNAHQDEFRLVDKRDSAGNANVCDCVKESGLFTENGGSEAEPFETGHALNEVFWDTFFKTKGFKNELFDANIAHIIITDKYLTNKWFAHAKDNFRVISMGGMDKRALGTLDSYVIMLLAKYFAWYSLGLSSEQIYDDLNHKKPIGCFFDAGQYSRHSVIYMVRNDICKGCENKLLGYGMSNEQLNAIKILLKLMKNRTFDKVFIVHGHEGKDAVARYIESLNIQAVILSERPNKGYTIIEKLEEYSDVDFAIILYTPDDVGYDKNTPDNSMPRARQNVIFEHGYFMAKLGRENVVVLLKNDTEKAKLETTGDNDGIVYIQFDEHGGWKEQIRKSLRHAGYKIKIA